MSAGDTEDVLRTLRDYVQVNFLYMRSGLQFGDEESLLARGIVDSLGVMELVAFVEETWGVEVPPEDVVEANFGSLAAIRRYLAHRRP